MNTRSIALTAVTLAALTAGAAQAADSMKKDGAMATMEKCYGV